MLAYVFLVQKSGNKIKITYLSYSNFIRRTTVLDNIPMFEDFSKFQDYDIYIKTSEPVYVVSDVPLTLPFPYWPMLDLCVSVLLFMLPASRFLFSQISVSTTLSPFSSVFYLLFVSLWKDILKCLIEKIYYVCHIICKCLVIFTLFGILPSIIFTILKKN